MALMFGCDAGVNLVKRHAYQLAFTLIATETVRGPDDRDDVQNEVRRD